MPKGTPPRCPHHTSCEEGPVKHCALLRNHHGPCSFGEVETSPTPTNERDEKHTAKCLELRRTGISKTCTCPLEQGSSKRFHPGPTSEEITPTDATKLKTISGIIKETDAKEREGFAHRCQSLRADAYLRICGVMSGEDN
jgi:hypothetical protein